MEKTTDLSFDSQAACRDLHTDSTIVDGKSLVSPPPIPETVDGSLGSVNGKVADGKLLVSTPDTKSPWSMYE